MCKSIVDSYDDEFRKRYEEVAYNSDDGVLDLHYPWTWKQKGDIITIVNSRGEPCASFSVRAYYEVAYGGSA